ncbi:MAG: hypothetical protein RIM99_12075 [Cyclobacteriaceae bacterium]
MNKKPLFSRIVALLPGIGSGFFTIEYTYDTGSVTSIIEAGRRKPLE